MSYAKREKQPAGVTVVVTLYIIVALLRFISCAIFTSEAKFVLARVIGIEGLSAVGFSVSACTVYLLREIIYSIKVGYFSPWIGMMVIRG